MLFVYKCFRNANESLYETWCFHSIVFSKVPRVNVIVNYPFRLKSSRNSLAGSTLVITKVSLALEQATYNKCLSVLYTSSRSASFVIFSILSCNGIVSSSHPITITDLNSNPFARCVLYAIICSNSNDFLVGKMLCLWFQLIDRPLFLPLRKQIIAGIFLLLL